MFRITMILFSLLLSGQVLADEEEGRRFYCSAFYNDLESDFLSPTENRFVFDLNDEPSWPGFEHEFTMPGISGKITLSFSVLGTNDVDDALRIEIFREISGQRKVGTTCRLSFKHKSSHCVLHTLEQNLTDFGFGCIKLWY